MSRLDEHFLQMALGKAALSNDPSTKVGAVIVDSNNVVVSDGFNSFPHGIANDARWHDREAKLEIVVHAEMNAVLAAARNGRPTHGCTIYVAATDGSKEIWGGPPCVRCTVECMQAGIVEYVSRPAKIAPSRWHASIAKTKALLTEAGLRYREVPQPMMQAEFQKEHVSEFKREFWCSRSAELGCPLMSPRCSTCPLDRAGYTS